MKIESLFEIIKEIDHQGGIVYYVGGCVRDELIGVESKDIDLEIHNMEVIKLKSILSMFGEVEEVGASFGIFMIKGLDIDFAMPRRERSIGTSHTSFEIEIDPYIGTYEASKRRDFTIGSLMKNAITGEVVDHFGGIDDIKKGIVRHVDDNSFVEDPLRVFRACQFASRFNFKISKETIFLISTIDTKTLPRKRIFDEVEKSIIKGNLGVFLKELKAMNQCEYYFGEFEDIHLDYISHVCSLRKISIEEGLSIIHFYTSEKNDVLENFVEKKSLLRVVRNTVSLLHGFLNRECKLEEVLLQSVDIELFISLASFLNISVKENIRELQRILSSYTINGDDLIQAGLRPNSNFKKDLELAKLKQLAGFSKEEAISYVIRK